MVTEDFVSYETAKLLKKKGFAAYVKSYYNRTAEFNGNVALWNYNISEFRYSAPTLQMTMKWLRNNFNLNPVPYALSLGWAFDVFNLSDRDITGCKKIYSMDFPTKNACYKTYEEAAEAAIKYCLKNLI